MNHFEYRDNILFAEEVDIRNIVNQVQTPCFVYSRATLERHWNSFDGVFAQHPHLICYAVKANSSLGVLNVLARLGSGFDIVSAGELQRVLQAGGDPSKVVFSGVGKKAEEIKFALQTGIHCFNVESSAELEVINKIAIDLNVQAPISIRVNPDVDANTHPYISTGLKQNKFGIEYSKALPLYQRAAKMHGLNVVGIDCHIGSQLSEVRPFVDALRRVLSLIDQLADLGIKLKHIDVGGGLGITYQEEAPPSPAEYATAMLDLLKDRNLEIIVEPGRAIAGNAGILLTQVVYLKYGEEKNFAVVDAAMNDLLRPSLYQAWQNIIPVVKVAIDSNQSVTGEVYDVVGPVCETGDFLGKNRLLNIASGDVLAVCSAGAYGFSMSSNYNTRPRAAEVMVDGEQIHVIREREKFADLIKGETILPDSPS